jgi:hypothetical protein
VPSENLNESDDHADRHGDGGRDEVDAITQYRFGMLGFDPDETCGRSCCERMNAVYECFLKRVPFETLSNQISCSRTPEDPESWPRATDRLLRENLAYGLGGTSFTLAYALRDLLRGVGANAHCALGRNLVTEEMHAAVIAYADEGSWLYDPALLASGPMPARPGGLLQDPLGTICLEPRSGATLTVTLTTKDASHPRQVYSIIPAPTPPHRYRQAWVASFHKGRREPLRLARRVGNEIRRYGEQPRRLEIISASGRVSRELGGAPIAELNHLFGIDEECLRMWFDTRPDEA